MWSFELQPLSGGTSVPVPSGDTVLGRGPLLGVSDKRVSRSHALLQNCDGELRLKSTHVNPVFVQSSSESSPSPLTRDQWRVLQPGDSLSLLPGQLCFRVCRQPDQDLRLEERPDQRLDQRPDQRLEPDPGQLKSEQNQDQDLKQKPDETQKHDRDSDLKPDQNGRQNRDQSPDRVQALVLSPEQDVEQKSKTQSDQENTPRNSQVFEDEGTSSPIGPEQTQSPPTQQKKIVSSPRTRVLPSWMMSAVPTTSYRPHTGQRSEGRREVCERGRKREERRERIKREEERERRSIHFLPLYPGSGRGGSSLSRTPSSSLSTHTSSSSSLSTHTSSSSSLSTHTSSSSSLSTHTSSSSSLSTHTSSSSSLSTHTSSSSSLSTHTSSSSSLSTHTSSSSSLSTHTSSSSSLSTHTPPPALLCPHTPPPALLLYL
ncbi:hypothetical protein WMY93_006792 [Mugilogobius chulae]|uniref:FHA domain-containing protein n=1 Tax=Mugilogobius chulae TaxID=88201 RepID=A0AAW0PL79_9GOBI